MRHRRLEEDCRPPYPQWRKISPQTPKMKPPCPVFLSPVLPARTMCAPSLQTPLLQRRCDTFRWRLWPSGGGLGSIDRGSRPRGHVAPITVDFPPVVVRVGFGNVWRGVEAK
ncbi:hypothetical protein TNCV_279531 [Trichonephila clavipes]|nr:hypothetical protein TNCV_279531 [Trichonephila clavipes]